MLYVNVYVVSRAYGGAEEGGWWYDAGEPIASIPIATDYQKGKDYFCSDYQVHVRECPYCAGSGEVGCSDETCACENDLDERGEPLHVVRCQDCGEVPADLQAVGALMTGMRDLLKDEPRRREELRVCLEKHFAAPYPTHRPTYE